MRPSSHPAPEVWEWLPCSPQLLRIIAGLFLYHWYFNTFRGELRRNILAVFLFSPALPGRWLFLLFPSLVTLSMLLPYDWELADGLRLALQGQTLSYILPNRWLGEKKYVCFPGQAWVPIKTGRPTHWVLGPESVAYLQRGCFRDPWEWLSVNFWHTGYVPWEYKWISAMMTWRPSSDFSRDVGWQPWFWYVCYRLWP